MNRYYLIIISVFVAIVHSCTDYQEEEVPVKFSVDAQELDFGLSSGSKTLTVSSGAKWSVASVPEWVGVKSIDRSAPYEWDVTFSVTANDEYNRDGVIVIKSGSEESQVIVTQEGKKGKYVAVESISLSAPELTIMEGENASLTYVITPTDASVKEVSWKSSSPYVATVSQSGRVDAITEGTTIILVTTEDGNKTASCTVTVKAKVIPVTGVTLDKASLSLTEGDEVSLTATVTPSDATDKSVTWSSSNTTVASVSKTGVVTAKSAGAATITATTNDGGKKAICAVTVQAQKVSATGVSLNKTSLTMTEGDTQTLTATVTPSNATDKSVTWSSSNTSVATVSSSGVVTAKAAGTATITATTNDGAKKATCTVTVKAATVSVTGVSLDNTSLSMTVGNTQTLTATVSPTNASDKSVTWSSNNASVATVSTSGVITAKSAGIATITVTTNDGAKKATCAVTVKAATVPVTGVSLDKTSLSMMVGDTQTLTATITPSNATDKSVTWSSSNSSVATVSSSGLVTAKAAGTTSIVVKTTNGGKTASCFINVSQPTSPTIPNAVDLGLSVRWASFNLGATSPEEHGDYYAWGETEPYYESLNPLIWKEGKELGYSWSSYKWCVKTGASTLLLKYCRESSSGYNGFTDGKASLDLDDDAAYVCLGNMWRMPTMEEISELQHSCKWEWTSINGVKGYSVTGPNQNSIFLPAASYLNENDTNYYAVGNYYGVYWSSSLATGSTFVSYNAGCLGFDGGGSYWIHPPEGVWRYFGGSIRAVSE